MAARHPPSEPLTGLPLGTCLLSVDDGPFAGDTQPDTVPYNEQGYLYSGVVPHAVTVA